MAGESWLTYYSHSTIGIYSSLLSQCQRGLHSKPIPLGEADGVVIGMYDDNSLTPYGAFVNRKLKLKLHTYHDNALKEFKKGKSVVLLNQGRTYVREQGEGSVGHTHVCVVGVGKKKGVADHLANEGK
tara:strand:+ start:464 stop:847 length:384 start_codon:yes stop_codon:yes gene_type:complete